MKKILYVILHTCVRPERYDGVVNSWGQNVDFLFYSDCDHEEKKIVKVCDDSSYSSNEPKHVNVIKYLVENSYDYEWFLFCDDDTFVNTKNLEDSLHLFDTNKINGSVLRGTWGTDTTLDYCSGGAGYIIHKTLLTSIAESIKTTNSGYSDVSLGICCRELGIALKHNDNFKSQNPKFYNEDMTLINDIFTFHYITPELMTEMYDIIKT